MDLKNSVASGVTAQGEPSFSSMLEAMQERSVKDSFSSLARVISPPLPIENSLEALVRELLHPIIAEWLNGHLPAIVQNMVQDQLAVLSQNRGA